MTRTQQLLITILSLFFIGIFAPPTLAASATWYPQPGIYFKYAVPVKPVKGVPQPDRFEHVLSTDLDTVKPDWKKQAGTFTQFKSTATRPATKYDPIVVVTPLPAPPTCANYVCTTENGDFIINVADSQVQKCPAFKVDKQGQMSTWDAVKIDWNPVTMSVERSYCPKGSYEK